MGAVMLALGGWLACPPRAGADDGAIENVGGAARLMGEQRHIRMAAETVRARVSPTRIEVDCVFVFENRGPADTVLVGFPDFSSGDVSGRPMREFRSWVDDVEVKCDTMADADSGADGLPARLRSPGTAPPSAA